MYNINTKVSYIMGDEQNMCYKSLHPLYIKMIVIYVLPEGIFPYLGRLDRFYLHPDVPNNSIFLLCNRKEIRIKSWDVVEINMTFYLCEVNYGIY